MLFISFYIPPDFFEPVFSVLFWDQIPSGTIMPMPKATMNKNHFSFARKYNVGLSGEIRAVDSKSVAESENQRTDNKLGHGILASNSTHNPASFAFRENICHFEISIRRLWSVSHSPMIILYSSIK
jgi:hypothetical protein